MLKRLYTEEHVAAIAAKIREKLGNNTTYKVSQMPDGIDAVYEAGKAAGGGASGGSGSDSNLIKGILDRTATEIFCDTVETVANYAVYNNQTLESVNLPIVKTIGQYSFQACRNLSNINFPIVEKIDTMAFQSCAVEKITLPETLKTLAHRAFGDCSKLTTVTFKSKPKTISAYAFSDSTGITVINVPWASGEVSSAPWGATNATINYNYTGG